MQERKQRRSQRQSQKQQQAQKQERRAQTPVPVYYPPTEDHLTVEPEDTAWDDERETSSIKDIEYNLETLGYGRPLHAVGFIVKTEKGYRYFFTKKDVNATLKNLVDQIVQKLNEGKTIEEIKGTLTSGGRSRTDLKKVGIIFTEKSKLVPLAYFTPAGGRKKENIGEIVDPYLEEELKSIKTWKKMYPSQYKEKIVEEILSKAGLSKRKKKEVKKYVLERIEEFETNSGNSDSH